MKTKAIVRSVRQFLGLTRVVAGYQGKEIALATLHHKERVIAPVFRRALGARVIVAPVDTDTLGTFSGEVERPAPPHRVVVTKAKMGMHALGLARGLATEGSFGPHPAIPFVTVHHELMAFVDREAGIEIVEQKVCLHPMYDAIEIGELSEAAEFLKKFRFGDYGLIVQAVPPDGRLTRKGIREIGQLEDAVQEFRTRSGSGKVRLMTDMRAHMNPLRMWRIRELARLLAKRLATSCPICRSPGWGMTGREGGLPCEECGTGTEATSNFIFSCSACQHEQRVPRADGMTLAPARECPWCNP